MSAWAPKSNPLDLISVASWPNNSSLWNPALNFAGSYGLSSTTASALSMKRFWRRSYNPLTIAGWALLFPQYADETAAPPGSVHPARVASRSVTGGGGGAG